MSKPQETVNIEALRLAQRAMEEATTAGKTALLAAAAIESHEKVCAERYSGIHNTLSSLQSTMTTSHAELLKSIHSLSNVRYESVGKWKGISYVSIAVGIALALINIIKAL